MTTRSVTHDWNRLLEPYTGAHVGKASWQLTSTVGLYALTWCLAYRALEQSWVLTLMLTVVAAGLLVRLFVIQHDCCHASFFPSRRANDVVGSVLGAFMLMPHHYWRRTHAIHHATFGDLDRRSFGDLETLTVEEYLSLSRWGRLRYRLCRSLFVLLVLGPTWQFIIKQRFPWDMPRHWSREWASVAWTNVAGAALAAVGCATIGWKPLLLVQVPITLIWGAIGIWFFYVQHQFEDTYWQRHTEWNFERAGIEGSSFYDLPRWLHWFTGNIGYHHVHHLTSRIPNYRLPECFREIPELHGVTRLDLRKSLRCARLKLWDEDTQRLVGFGDLRSSLTASSVGEYRPDARVPVAWRT
jgi:omega-6 fatty acid desaturase (delta-12 desaturase)